MIQHVMVTGFLSLDDIAQAMRTNRATCVELAKLITDQLVEIQGELDKVKNNTNSEMKGPAETYKKYVYNNTA